MDRKDAHREKTTDLGRHLPAGLRFVKVSDEPEEGSRACKGSGLGRRGDRGCPPSSHWGNVHSCLEVEEAEIYCRGGPG